jgi:transposase InsO family protein
MEIVTKCKDYQFFQKQTTKHANPLRPIDLACPFTIWGIDIVGMLPRAMRGYKFLLVAIDTLNKWMEAMPVVNITQEEAIKFSQRIIFRFSVPRWVLIDNGTQFKEVKFVRCCIDFNIEHQASSIAHPQINR